MPKRSTPLRTKPATPILRTAYHRTPNDIACARFLQRHPHLARLRASAPALLVALSQETYGATATERAIAQLRQGVPIDGVMRGLRFPAWLNDFGEDALIADFSGQPTSKAFGALMTKHPLRPSSPAKTAELLFATQVAHRFGGERAATILLPFLVVEPCVLEPASLAIVATFMATLEMPACPAHRYIVAPPEVTSLCALTRAAVSWLSLLLLAVQYGPQGAPPWRKGTESRGHDITWVRTADDLVALARSGRALRPDAAFQAPSYILDLARIVTIARDGNEIGHAELRLGGRHGDELQVYRVDTPHDMGLAPAARRAVHAMLGEDPPYGHPGEPDAAAPQLDPERLQVAWTDLMAPVLRQMQPNDIFPAVLTPDAFVTLLDQAFSLGVHCGLGHALADAIHAFDMRFV